MSTSSPVRNRQPRRPSRPPEAASERSPRDASVVARSILLVVAAVSVIATSNYFAYLIGRKQVTYEELRRQVDLVVQFIEEGLASATVKQQQDRPKCAGSHRPDDEHDQREDNGRRARARARRKSGARGAGRWHARPDNEARAQAPVAECGSAAQQRGPRRPKVSPPRRDPAAAAFAEQPGQSTTAPSATPDAGLAGQ